MRRTEVNMVLKQHLCPSRRGSLIDGGEAAESAFCNRCEWCLYARLCSRRRRGWREMAAPRLSTPTTLPPSLRPPQEPW